MKSTCKYLGVFWATASSILDRIPLTTAAKGSRSARRGLKSSSLLEMLIKCTMPKHKVSLKLPESLTAEGFTRSKLMKTGYAETQAREDLERVDQSLRKCNFGLKKPSKNNNKTNQPPKTNKQKRNKKSPSILKTIKKAQRQQPS